MSGAAPNLEDGPARVAPALVAVGPARHFQEVSDSAPPSSKPLDAGRSLGEAYAQPGLTFAEAAEETLREARINWTSEGTERTWRRVMSVHAAGFQDKPLSAVSEDDIAAALAPLWTSKPALAARIRKLWERVLNHPSLGTTAAARRRNPARWSPALKSRLQPKPPGAGATASYRDLPFFLEQLRAGRGLGRQALELSVLTCLPPQTICGLVRSDLRRTDLGWMLKVEVEPKDQGDGMERAWRSAPLTDAAAGLVWNAGGAASHDGDGFIFKGSARDRSLPVGGVRVLANRLFGVRAARLEPDAVAAAFRAWAHGTSSKAQGARLGYANETIEAALGSCAVALLGEEARPACRSAEIRSLFAAWQTFLGRG